MPIDIKLLRADQGGDPEKWRENQRKRFKDETIVDRALEFDNEWRRLTTRLRDLSKEKNAQSRLIGKAIKEHGADSAEVERLKGEVTAMSAEVESTKARLDEVAALRDAEVSKLANETHPDVPISETEADNAVRLEWGSLTPPVEKPRMHFDLLWMIGGYDPHRGTAVAGHRGYFLTGPGVRLNLALIQYGLNFLRARGYSELQPPYFMNKDVMSGVAQLEDFDDQLYKVVGTRPVVGEDGTAETEVDEKYLIATSEQPVCVFHKGERLEEKDLPKMYAGWSSCFRKEAGKHGTDTRGIFRVHQFDKIEQFCVTAPDDSWRMHEEMRGNAEEFLKSLGIPFRVVDIVSKELNNAAARKYDMEGWFPGFGEYKELVSCSNCTDYQARAMDTRFGPVVKGDVTHCHLLNSTLCATTRTISAILENNQTADGIVIPEVLRPYVGQDFFPFVNEPLGPDGKPGNPKKKKSSKKTEKAKEAPAAPAPAASAPAVSAPVASRVNISSPVGMAQLDARLLTASYVDGFSPSPEDALVFGLVQSYCSINRIPEPDAAVTPNVARWFRHMNSFSPRERADLVGSKTKSSLFEL